MKAPCPQCEDRGAVRATDPERQLPTAFGLCTCAAGQLLRHELAAAVENKEQGSETEQPIERRFGCSIDRIWPIEDLVESGPKVKRARAPLNAPARVARR